MKTGAKVSWFMCFIVGAWVLALLVFLWMAMFALTSVIYGPV